MNSNTAAIHLYRCLYVSALLCLAPAAHAASHYVSPTGTNNPPYTNWADAATNIQWAVDAATNGETVWVTNGNYVLTNQIVVTNGIVLKSVNGRDATFLNGNYPACTNRCFFISNDAAVIDGFTLTNGCVASTSDLSGRGGGLYINSGLIKNCLIGWCVATNRGGGIYGDSTSVIVSNCFISSNFAGTSGGGTYQCTIYNSIFVGCRSGLAGTGGSGGGANLGILYNCSLFKNYSRFDGGALYAGAIYNCNISNNWCTGVGGASRISDMYNCVLAGNVAGSEGGGAYNGNLYNCTLAGNSSGSRGGGAYSGGLYNCIVYFNYAPAESNCSSLSAFVNSCTTPTQSQWSAGSITNDPIFAANGSGYGTNCLAGNYRLSANSPCVNAGTNQSWMTNTVDLDGRQRIRYGIVDMGAYEIIYEGTFYRLGF